MAGISIGRPHPRPCSGGKTLRRRVNYQETDNVILIDLDSEHVDNVVIIDVPESLPKTTRARSKTETVRKQSYPNIICIDDDEDEDEDEDETLETSQSDDNVNNGTSSGFASGRFTAHTSSSRNPCHGKMKFADAEAEERQFFQETVTPVRLSKCKRTYSREGSARSHYGLNTDSECDSSDSDDSPDSVLMDDSSGKVQEQWEKAFFRRQKDIYGDNSGFGDQDRTTQGINENHHQNVETEGETRQQKNTAFYPRESTCSDEPESSFYSRKSDAPFSHAFDDPVYDFSLHSPPDLFGNRSDACFQSNSQDKDSSFIYSRAEPPTSADTSHQEQPAVEVKYQSPTFKDEEVSITEPCNPQSEMQHSKESCYGDDSPVEHEATMYQCQNSFETEAASSTSFLNDNHKSFEKISMGGVKDGLKPLHPCATAGAKEGQDFMPEISTVRRSTLPDEQANQSFSPGDTVGPLPGNSCSSNFENCFISEREKLKETDEYKRAIEEEWAFRKQELQIQAEEAQRLRQLQKRRKAEAMRVSDMERRQKQRVKEMRDLQKRDEENLNLKEVIRAGIRKDLTNLEVSCHDMASLLHCLGIRISGWPQPSTQEVQAAYKRALLTFHPDRVSRSDIRQQVDAEEKFKLVNRLKEKFLT